MAGIWARAPMAPQVAKFVPVPSLQATAGEHELASQWQPLVMVLPINLQFCDEVPVPRGQAFNAVVPDDTAAHALVDTVQLHPVPRYVPMAPQLVPAAMVMDPVLQEPCVHCVAAIQVLVDPDTANLQPVPRAAPTETQSA